MCVLNVHCCPNLTQGSVSITSTQSSVATIPFHYTTLFTDFTIKVCNNFEEARIPKANMNILLPDVSSVNTATAARFCYCVRQSRNKVGACKNTGPEIDNTFNLVTFKVQGGSNMTGTDLCVNKPHCAAAVRP